MAPGLLNDTAVIITESMKNAFTIPSLREAIFPLLLYVAAMVLYSVAIWHFYRFISSRDIITIDLSKYDLSPHPRLAKSLASLLYVAKFSVVFPLISFAAFSGLSVLLFFLSRTADVQTILLTSITLVSAIRATAYYSEDLSKDIAKLIPLALLAVFALDPSFLSLELVRDRITRLPFLVPLMATYLSFIVILEVFLKMLHYTFVRLSPPSDEGA